MIRVQVYGVFLGLALAMAGPVPSAFAEIAGLPADPAARGLAIATENDKRDKAGAMPAPT